MTNVAWPDAETVWSSNDRALELARAVLGAADAPVGLTPKELIWRKNKARLYRYLRSTPATHKTPIFLVLPLINRAYILDLRPGASFVEFLLAEGHDVFLIDWGTPGDEDRALDVTTLVTRYLPRAAKAIQKVTGVERMTVLGYCIGGVLATCFAALQPGVTRNLVLLTAPIDFSDAGQFGRMTARDIFPVEQLTDTFATVPAQLPDIGTKLLNPMASYAGTYRQLWDKLADPNFDVSGWQAMYRWVNDSVPFAGAAFRQWIVEFYQENRLALDTLEMDGKPVRMANITCPVLNIAASRDQIAPRPTTSVITNRVGSADASEIVIEGGHVGIVVGRSASQNL
ncbi:MAG: poly[(R)-3-hydroxyalkanoate] polymerase subunit PhaC, partial [Chloroflexota bacterium]|nr:poly[(R)-3-hydroxyalkanoate] polymerase subunit PhaC [Chloroflexota bacterium]